MSFGRRKEEASPESLVEALTNARLRKMR